MKMKIRIKLQLNLNGYSVTQVLRSAISFKLLAKFVFEMSACRLKFEHARARVRHCLTEASLFVLLLLHACVKAKDGHFAYTVCPEKSEPLKILQHV